MATGYEREPPPSSVGANLGVIVLIIATIAAGVWFVLSRRASGDTTSPSPSPSPVAESAAVTPPPQPTAVWSPAATPIATATPAATAPARAIRPRAAVPAADSPALAPPLQPTSTPTPTPTQAPVLPAVVAPRVSTPEPDAAVYDAATRDVTPPSLLTPIGIAPVRTNYVPGLATIEVVVGHDGLVQSAKAGKPPATVGETLEMMNWLSAAKSWRFGPAVKNSQPVKYRLVVPLSALVSGQGIR